MSVSLYQAVIYLKKEVLEIFLPLKGQIGGIVAGLLHQPRGVSFSRALLSAYAEDHGLWPWMNAKRITLRSLVRPSSAVACYGGWIGGYASADSAEEHGGTTGFARGAPWHSGA